MPELFLSETEDKKLQDLIDLYYKAKDLIFSVEEYSDQMKSNPQVLIEIRNAFDHLMKVFASKYKKLSGDKNETLYSEKHFDKSYGHVYRSGYDALDLLNIYINLEIKELLNKYPSNVIVEIFPEYYKTIRPKLIENKEKITQCRMNKDVDGENSENERFTNFTEYNSSIQELQELRKLVILKEGALADYFQKYSEEQAKIEGQRLKEKAEKEALEKKRNRRTWIWKIGRAHV